MVIAVPPTVTAPSQIAPGVIGNPAVAKESVLRAALEPSRVETAEASPAPAADPVDGGSGVAAAVKALVLRARLTARPRLAGTAVLEAVPVRAVPAAVGEVGARGPPVAVRMNVPPDRWTSGRAETAAPNNVHAPLRAFGEVGVHVPGKAPVWQTPVKVKAAASAELRVAPVRLGAIGEAGPPALVKGHAHPQTLRVRRKPAATVELKHGHVHAAAAADGEAGAPGLLAAIKAPARRDQRAVKIAVIVAPKHVHVARVVNGAVGIHVIPTQRVYPA